MTFLIFLTKAVEVGALYVAARAAVYAFRYYTEEHQ